MASVSDICSIVNILSGCFCQPVTRRISLLRSLSSQAEDLSTEATAIGGLKKDLSAKVAALLAEDRRMEQSQQATDWFGSVDAVLDSCRSFEDRFRNRRSSWNILRCGCSRNYYLAKDMKQQLERVRNLKEQGRSFTDEQLVAFVPPDVVEELTIEFQVFGQDEKLKEVLGKIEDREVNMVGICGMGGIGKTTLLQTINNHFFRNGAGGFDVILYTTVGSERDILRMQREIGNRLRLSFSKDCQDEVEQARMILHSLQSKNFLVLLDDLWEKLDLGKLGLSSARKKVVMTARDEKVCTDMGVRERGMVRMDLLSDQDSWQLFSEKVGNDDVLRDPEIEALAGDVADKCGGLPLALATVGTAMASATEVHEWRNAKLELEKNARAVAGMEQEVLSPLKFSFDKLENDALRQILFLCLLQGGRFSVERTWSLARHIAGEGLFLSDPKPNLYNWESTVDKRVRMARIKAEDDRKSLEKIK